MNYFKEPQRIFIQYHPHSLFFRKGQDFLRSSVTYQGTQQNPGKLTEHSVTVIVCWRGGGKDIPILKDLTLS